MERSIIYNRKEKTLCISYPFSDEYAKTLLTIHNNGNETEFDNRDLMLTEDVDGNEISWKICDDLVEMGLLEEDEESFDVFFEMSNEGLEVVYDLLKPIV